MNRRSFFRNFSAASLAVASSPTFAMREVRSQTWGKPLKLSLAQWSLHRSFWDGKLKAKDFAGIAKTDFGIDAVEYVNGFYKEYGQDTRFWKDMRRSADAAGVKSLLIMVDGEGDLGSPHEADRIKAVENHYKWIDAAQILGCHSVRVNAFGHGSREQLRGALVDGLGQLADYGSRSGINVLVENHGLHTSDAAFIMGIIRSVGNPSLGTLPDFGNWCLGTEWGSTQGDKCVTAYDGNAGLAEMLPLAKGVSAKSYGFDNRGMETSIDYPTLLKMVYDSGFEGYIGIEFEGDGLSEAEGIKATKALIQKVWTTL